MEDFTPGPFSLSEVAYTFSSKSILEKLKLWGKQNFTLPISLAGGCCAVEIAQSLEAASAFENWREPGDILIPEEADVLIVSAALTPKMAQRVLDIYHRMQGPKWVMAIGSCSISGGPFQGRYQISGGLGDIIPVDIMIPGCPPAPLAIKQGLELLKDRVDKGVCSYLNLEGPA